MTTIASHTQLRTFSTAPRQIPIEYIHTSVPVGVTLRDYRRSLPRQASRWQRLKELAGGAR